MEYIALTIAVCCCVHSWCIISSTESAIYSSCKIKNALLDVHFKTRIRNTDKIVDFFHAFHLKLDSEQFSGIFAFRVSHCHRKRTELILAVTNSVTGKVSVTMNVHYCKIRAFTLTT